MVHAMDELIAKAEPNPAHLGIGELEKMGMLQYIITQNVDNLHQEGGAKIIEINLEKTHLTGTMTDVFIQGEAGKVIGELLEAIKGKTDQV